jgi:hypothetical protein
MALWYCWYCTCSLEASFERFGRCRFQAFVFVLASESISLLLRARRVVVTQDFLLVLRCGQQFTKNIAEAVLQVLLGKCALLGE